MRYCGAAAICFLSRFWNWSLWTGSCHCWLEETSTWFLRGLFYILTSEMFWFLRIIYQFVFRIISVWCLQMFSWSWSESINIKHIQLWLCAGFTGITFTAEEPGELDAGKTAATQPGHQETWESSELLVLPSFFFSFLFFLFCCWLWRRDWNNTTCRRNDGALIYSFSLSPPSG